MISMQQPFFPMLGFVTPTCGASMILTGEKPKHALGQGKYQVDKLVFKNNKLTGSEIRYTRMNSAFAKKARGKIMSYLSMGF
jgi:hypothetical protein